MTKTRDLASLSVSTPAFGDTVTLISTQETSNVRPNFNLKKQNPSSADGDLLGGINFYGINSAGNDQIYSKIAGYQQDITDGTEDGGVVFRIANAGNNPGNSAADRLKVDPTGITVIGDTSTVGLTASGTSSFEEIREKVSIDSSTTGTLVHALDTGPAIVLCNVDQTANRMINLTGLSSGTFLPVGQSITTVFMFQQGSTAYYINGIGIDGTLISSSVKWQGGTAPTSGNASGIDSYSITIINPAELSAYVVIASQTQFA